MSSSELPRTDDNQAGDESEALDLTSSARNVETSVEPMEQQVDTTSESTKMDCDSNASQPSPTSFTTIRSVINRAVSEELNVGASSSKTSSSDPIDQKPCQPTFDQKDVHQQPHSEIKEKADKGLGLGVAGPSAAKEFSLSISDLPFTKEQLAEHMSLEEACGFLPFLIKTKRNGLREMEQDMDQISVDLQSALTDVKNICLKLKNSPEDVPEDVNDAVIEAQKAVYLLSSSYRIFEKLVTSGSDLKEQIQAYAKETGDYHSSVDTLLDYIIGIIVKKSLAKEESD